jgi:AraC family transcriptional regulator of adaptative response / DNA-3-methyladenine glycosylase II
MKFTREEMLRALMASDGSYDGRFVTGVLSTGIYCLPSCRARKPKPENVQFFATFAEARAAGLRACRKCRPDAFERGESDHELDALERVVADLRARPDAYPDLGRLGEELGVGETKLFALTRRHYHTTPAALIAEARVAAAQRTLRTTDATVAEVAFGVGFETLSAFYANFQARTGMNPADYRRLREGKPFAVSLPCPYREDLVLRHLGRDAQSVTERVAGKVAEIGVRIEGEPATLRLDFADGDVRVSTEGAPAAHEAHALAVRILGFAQDAAGFEAHAERNGYGPLVRGREGTRIPQTPSVFDALVWSVVGQQVGLGFAYALRRRVSEALSAPMANGLRPPPLPAEIAGMEEADLVAMQFSRRKAEYLLGVARETPVLEGVSATRAEATLRAVRGFGPWAANYVMMRGLGFADCVPLGDTGLLAGLRKLHGRAVEQKEVPELMTAFAPYRSLATFHLWQSLSEEA